MSILARLLSRLFGMGKKRIPPVRKFAECSVCPICGASAILVDSVDFNKSCEEVRGRFLPRSGRRVDFHLCDACGFCFAPEFSQWHREEFAKYIYNSKYVTVDPDSTGARQNAQTMMLESLFGAHKNAITHFDYGGGAGLLTQNLKRSGWQSVTADPFMGPSNVGRFGDRYDLVTAFEVFEHVADPNSIITDLLAAVKPGGLILFSTLLSDRHIRAGLPLEWWYASPRNGHISLYSSSSLRLLFDSHRWKVLSVSEGLHAAHAGKMPLWAHSFQSALQTGN